MNNYKTNDEGSATRRSTSRQRLLYLKQEEQLLSQTFKIDKFYNNQTLDLTSLKDKLSQMKKKTINIKQNPQQPNTNVIKQKKLVSLSNRINKYSNQGSLLQHNKTKAGRQTASNNKRSSHSSVQQNYKQEQMANFYETNMKTGLAFYQQKITSKYINEDQEHRYGSTIIPKIYSIGRRHGFQSKLSQKSETLKNILKSNRLEPISAIKRKLSHLKIQNEDQLQKFEMNIVNVWKTYNKLCQITNYLSDQNQALFENDQKCGKLIQLLSDYKSYACSTKFEFLKQITNNCIQFNHCKALIVARILQNLSIAYVFLQFIEQIRGNNKKIYSYLVNFVGLSSNSLLLTLRLITLVTVIDYSLVIPINISQVYKAISQFQQSSYRSQLASIKQTMRRIQHNNQLILIIQSKLNNKMIMKEYHKSCIGSFVKQIILNTLKEQLQNFEDKDYKQSQGSTKPFYEYSYFIFEYLAFHLHHENCIGIFPKQIQTAPSPYIATKKQFTIIIDPVKALLYRWKQKIFVRFYALQFILEMQKKCNVVFWSTQMPSQVDELFDLVDPRLNNMVNKKSGSLQNGNQGNQKSEVKRLYKHHCCYDYNSKGQIELIKDISRVGCESNKYIIIDSNDNNFYEKQKAKIITMPWKGEQSDNKLVTVLDIILQFLRQGADLTKSMILLKPRLQQLLYHKRKSTKKVQN